MRELLTGVFHCTGSREGVDLSVQDIRNMHIWPKDRRDKKGNLLSVSYKGKKYASREDLPEEVRDKNGRGWSDIGYHYVILLSGIIEYGRPLWRSGAHVYGFNKNTIGFVYVGGLDSNGKPKDTRTPNQIRSMKFLYDQFNEDFPLLEWKGHRDYSPDLNNNGTIERWEWIKSCPCFDVAQQIINWESIS